MTRPPSPCAPFSAESGSDATLESEERTHADRRADRLEDPHVHDRLHGHLSQLSTLFRRTSEVLRDLAREREIQLAARCQKRDMDDGVYTSERTSENGNPSHRQLLSVADLVALFQVEEKTIRRWRSENRLPDAVEIGGIVRWDPRVIDAWLQGGGE